MLTTLALSLVLAQAAPDPTAQPTDPTAPDLLPGPVNTPPTIGPTREKGNQFDFSPPRKPVNVDEVNRQLERIKKLPPSEMSEALEQLRKNVPNSLANPAAPNPALEPKEENPASKYWELSEPEQVKFQARIFFNDLIAGDARNIVLQSGYPFYLEDRRLELPNELHDEWLRNLRAKRTDLLTLYDIEVLSPAELEKKYGKPPARLANMPWKQPKTWIVVGNLSGHAAVAVYRQHPTGRTWQIVGYTD